jgi:putative ABC transport system permease protein
MKFALLILSNFKRHKLRTALTVLSIAVAFILFGYLAAVRQAFAMGVDVAGADRLVVRHKVSIIQLLPETYEASIERIEGVEQATPATWFGGIYQDERNFFAQIAVKPDEYIEMFPEFVVPADQREAWRKTRTGVVIGRGLANRFNLNIGDKLPLKGTIWRPAGGDVWTFDIVGIYDGAQKETDTSQLFLRYDYLDEARPFAKGMVGWYHMKISDPDRAAEIAAKVDETFANSPAETKTETEGAFVKAFADQVGNIGAIVTAILTAVFFTILLVAGNTMAQAVRERIGELGVLKAIGFTDVQMLALVLVESVVIAGLGGALGLWLGWMAVSAGDPTKGALPVFFLPSRDLLLGAIFVLVLGLVTGALPALQAMRLNAVDALRRE